MITTIVLRLLNHPLRDAAHSNCRQLDKVPEAKGGYQFMRLRLSQPLPRQRYSTRPLVFRSVPKIIGPDEWSAKTIKNMRRLITHRKNAKALRNSCLWSRTSMVGSFYQICLYANGILQITNHFNPHFYPHTIET